MTVTDLFISPPPPPILFSSATAAADAEVVHDLREEVLKASFLHVAARLDGSLVLEAQALPAPAQFSKFRETSK